MEQAIRLSPHDSYIAGWYWRIGTVHLLEARTDEAIVWLEKARSARPAIAVFHAFLAAAYALEGTTERASAELGEAQKLDNSYSSLVSLKKRLQLYSPKIRTMAETTYFAGLRLAGMAEE